MICSYPLLSMRCVIFLPTSKARSAAPCHCTAIDLAGLGWEVLIVKHPELVRQEEGPFMCLRCFVPEQVFGSLLLPACTVRQDGTPFLLGTSQAGGFCIAVVTAGVKNLARGSRNSTLYLVRKVLFSRSYCVFPGSNPRFLFSFSASFAPACLSHEIITRK